MMLKTGVQEFFGNIRGCKRTMVKSVAANKA